MTDEQLLQLLKERPNYKAPILFDEELAQLISKRGCENTFLKKKSLQRTTGIAILIGAMVGLFTGLANLPFAPVATIALLIYMFFGVGVGVYLAARVANSFKNHQYDATHQRLANAIWWNSNWDPFTCYPLIRCQNIELTMLMREARTLELEVYSQFCMALFEPTALQKSRYLVRWRNITWVGWLLAGRYAEAAEGFASCDLSKIEKQMRPILLNNLALAQIKSGDAEKAQDTLNRAFTELKGARLSSLNAKLEYIQSLVYLQQDALESAEAAVEKSERLTEKFPDDELRAECMLARGRILQKHRRFDESKLYFKNAIEIFSNCDNTQYLNLCFTMHYLAQMLMESGDEQSALALMHKVDEYMESYRNREERTCDRIKRHLLDAAKIRTGSDLLTLGERTGLMELTTTG